MPRRITSGSRKNRASHVSSWSVPSLRPLAASLLLISAGMFLPFASVRAGTIDVPPVLIFDLSHRYYDGYWMDGITIPGPGYSNSGFTAALTPGDRVRVHLVAPPGKQFVVTAPVTHSDIHFAFDVYWVDFSAPSAILTAPSPHTLEFEGFHGSTPVEIYSLVYIRSSGNWIHAKKDFQVGGPFEFTGILIDIDASSLTSPVTRTFGPVNSNMSYSFCASGAGETDTRMLEIRELEPVRVSASSWGRLKALYR